jgi:hypothetical protein
LEKRKPHNAQWDFNLRLCRWLRNRRMGDVANLAGAVRFVVRIAVIVSHHLGAQNEDR